MAAFYSEQQLTVCPLCNEFDITNWWCNQCQFLMCTNCRNGHQQIPLTRDHSLEKRSFKKDTGTGYVSQICALCKEHNAQFALYCRTCEEFVCPICMVEGHKEHELRTIKQTYDEKEIHVKTISVSANMKKTCFESELKHVNLLRQNCAASLESAKEKIKQRQMELKQQIDDKAEQCLSTLHTNHTSSLKDYEEKEHIINTHISEVNCALLKLERSNKNPDIKTCFRDFQEIQNQLDKPLNIQMITVQQEVLSLKKNVVNFGEIKVNRKAENRTVPGIKVCWICNKTVVNKAGLQCKHEFCKICLDQHFKAKRNCPVCARNYDFKAGVCFDEKNYKEENCYGSTTICFEFVVKNYAPDNSKKNFFMKLPKSEKGELVRHLLKFAFDKNVLFVENRNESNKSCNINAAGMTLQQFISCSSYGTKTLSDNDLNDVLSELAVLGVTEVDI